ncbi:hypothetical protein GDO81_004678 [Engystomops pustulosus]|uniref:Uncharacterized protein n=1 Tax=Engystomops pustulosus TaxID=76066 RepID=A0AAV7CIU1_ENGPU|nr:hypothetical protein GDO81_004678 [Engystomops pustulosus]
MASLEEQVIQQVVLDGSAMLDTLLQRPAAGSVQEADVPEEDTHLLGSNPPAVASTLEGTATTPARRPATLSPPPTQCSLPPPREQLDEDRRRPVRKIRPPVRLSPGSPAPARKRGPGQKKMASPGPRGTPTAPEDRRGIPAVKGTRALLPSPLLCTPALRPAHPPTLPVCRDSAPSPAPPLLPAPHPQARPRPEISPSAYVRPSEHPACIATPTHTSAAPALPHPPPPRSPLLRCQLEPAAYASGQAPVRAYDEPRRPPRQRSSSPSPLSRSGLPQSFRLPQGPSPAARQASGLLAIQARAFRPLCPRCTTDTGATDPRPTSSNGTAEWSQRPYRRRAADTGSELLSPDRSRHHHHHHGGRRGHYNSPSSPGSSGHEVAHSRTRTRHRDSPHRLTKRSRRTSEHPTTRQESENRSSAHLQPLQFQRSSRHGSQGSQAPPRSSVIIKQPPQRITSASEHHQPSEQDKAQSSHQDTSAPPEKTSSDVTAKAEVTQALRRWKMPTCRCRDAAAISGEVGSQDFEDAKRA